MNFDAPLLPLAISLLAAVWLGVCAWSDLRTRHVSNGLTLPAIPLAILAAWLTRESRGERLFEFAFHLVVMTLPLFVAWRSHLLGGADLKILLALTLVNPLLVAAAWIGVVVYFAGLMVVGEWRYRRSNQQNFEPPFARTRPARFAGVPGFALGAGLFAAGQVAMLFAQNLAA